jgi:hypothetical protein
MSLIRLLPASVHALSDYLAGLVLLVVGGSCLGPANARGTGVALGLALMSISLLTRYPLGVLPIVRFPVHSAGDYLTGLLAVVAPFVLRFYPANPGVSATYIIVGIAVIVLGLGTDYSWLLDRQRRRADQEQSGVPVSHR